MMTGPHYEVFSLHVASDLRRTVGTNFFFDSFPTSASVPMPQDYVFWVIRNDSRCIVVDTCFTAASAVGRDRQMIRPVGHHLADLGIVPADVSDLVMTHLHWDHAGNIGLFPNARVHVQADEVAFSTGSAMLHRGVSKIYNLEDVQSVLVPLFEGRVQFIEGDVELFPGIVAAKVGGHTPGSMVLQVSTARGPIVIASDAAHFWANVHRRSPFPILDSFTQALRAFDRIYELAGGEIERIIPGHDPLVRQLFPSLPGLGGAACLHAAPLANVAEAIEAQFSCMRAA